MLIPKGTTGTHGVLHVQSDGVCKGFTNAAAATEAADKANEKAKALGSTATYKAVELPPECHNAKAAA
jgi:hypothetical protein